MYSQNENKPLTEKEEYFVQAYFRLKSSSAAYRVAYETSAKPEVIHVNAHRLLIKPNIAKRIEEIRAELKEKFVVEAVEKRMVLWDIATDENMSGSTRVSAIAELNKMDGDHAPTKINTARSYEEILNDFPSPDELQEKNQKLN